MIEGQIYWSPGVTLEAVEKQVILAAFRHYRGNKTATSNAIGISVRTLDNKLEKYEADGKAEKERQVREQKERDQFLARARGNGQIKDNIFTGDQPKNGSSAKETSANTGNDVQTQSGVSVESASSAAPKQAVPLPQRKEVQGVPQGQTAASSARKAR